MPNNVLEKSTGLSQSKSDCERLVIQKVLHQLGTPKNLFRTVAKPVSNHQYRVNVYCTDEANRPVKTVSITDSFFVTLSGEDFVSEPTISRKYE